jgi:hypothetical protein
MGRHCEAGSSGRSNLPAQEVHCNEAFGCELPVLTDCHAPQEAGLAMTYCMSLVPCP